MRWWLESLTDQCLAGGVPTEPLEARRQDVDRQRRPAFETQTARRGAWAPLQGVFSMLFFIVGRPVVVIVGRTLVAFFERSLTRIKSKRIFLSADAAFIVLIQPGLELPQGSFIVLCPVARFSCDHL